MPPASPDSNPLQPFAWAGLYMHTPPAMRLFRVDGGYVKGNVGLADDQRPRLEIGWKLHSKRRFDPHRMIRQQLARTLPRAMRRQAEKHIQPVKSEHFASLLRYTDENRRIDRCVGLARHSGRVIEMLIHFRDDDTPDEPLIRNVADSLRDQPTDQPQRWAFFGHRITTPADYHYHSSLLNIGDMSVRLTRADRPAASISVRIIYTAKLAMQRRGLLDWLAALHKEDRLNGDNLYYHQLENGKPRCDTIQTPLGEALRCDGRLRRTVRTVRWKLPKHQRRWIIHDTAQDRLVMIRVADDPDRFDPTFDKLIAGFDWREPNEPT